MRIGVLALQGAVEPHLQMLAALGVASHRVRTQEELLVADRLILPGGESTTMLRLLESTGLKGPLTEFGKNKPIWGICAGAILIAQEVLNPSQASLNLIAIRAHRNHYGSQLDSFQTQLMIEPIQRTMEVDFIRAPMLEPLTPHVSVLARNQDSAVLMRQGSVMVSAFHTELGKDPSLHKYFLDM